jgi:peptidyl-prolyl cis-trans isomerase B (cyclophilin B)
MKGLRILYLVIIAIALIAASCGEQKKEEPLDKAKQDSLAKSQKKDSSVVINPQYRTKAADTVQAQAEHPQYIITIRQGKKIFGDVVIELYPEVTPLHYRNFDSLVAIKFYDGLAFHRVIKGLLIQGGDPNSLTKSIEWWGRGDSTQYRVPAEFNKVKHLKGTISAARDDNPNGANSQFFIVLMDMPKLNGQYTAYGRVIQGIEIVEAVSGVEVKPFPFSNEPSLPVQKVTMTIRKK